ncbi:ATP-binding protein [Streptomyces uncialis]|uniref:ATP-binding protein n=1 Tax=Streptomyces uncialis TaxID=1048205 RepID=UPI0022550F6B|nr:ATP-binding protein [Streptomyces uncialis]MCX4659595.1 ATP-binding protein [Streptomyces uncialis]
MTPLTLAGAAPVLRPPVRPGLTELRLTACAAHLGTTFGCGPLTFLSGPSGSGRTSALRGYEALARLGGGAPLDETFPDPGAWVPERARPDPQRRRGFRLGCTTAGPAGPVRLDLTIQAEPELRLVAERLTTADGTVLLSSALRDPRRRTVQAAWHTGGGARVTHAPLPDDRLGTALLPLRVAGSTEGQRLVLAAAEQLVVALRSVFVCDPRPDRMRALATATPATAPGRAGTRPGPEHGRLRTDCGNLAAVLRRTRAECPQRHARFVAAARAGCAGPVADVRTEDRPDGTVRAVLDRGDGHLTPLHRLGDGELRYLALALVLLTGPGVLDVDPVAEVPAAFQCLTVLADDFDRCLDNRQTRALARLAASMCARGHVRLVGSVRDATAVREGVAAAGTATDGHHPAGDGYGAGDGYRSEAGHGSEAGMLTVVDLGR